MGKADRLYKIDLRESIKAFPISLVLDKVKPLVGEGTVYNLISSLLNLPRIFDYGDDTRIGVSCQRECGIPLAGGEITRVLFNIVLMDIFDREFPKGFPGVAFCRFIHEVFFFF